MTILTAKPTALDTFFAKAGEFNALLERLQQMRDGPLWRQPGCGHLGPRR